MAPHPLLGIFLIGIIFLSSMTSGYNQVVEPLSGRTFSLLNLLPFQRISSIQYTALQSRVTAVETNLNTLTTQLAASAEQCPAASKLLGAQLIGTYCYAVFGATVSNRKGFVAALEKCQSAGGSLAEPQVTRVANKDFYNALKAKFPDAFTIIEKSNGGKLWIGYYIDFVLAPAIIRPATTGIQIPPTIPTYFPTTVDIQLPVLPVLENSGVLLNKPVSNDVAYWTTDTFASVTALYPFICQFTALA